MQGGTVGDAVLRLEGSIMIEARPGASMGSKFAVCVELEESTMKGELDEDSTMKGELDEELVRDGVTDDCGAACFRLTASL